MIKPLSLTILNDFLSPSGAHQVNYSIPTNIAYELPVHDDWILQQIKVSIMNIYGDYDGTAAPFLLPLKNGVFTLKWTDLIEPSYQKYGTINIFFTATFLNNITKEYYEERTSLKFTAFPADDPMAPQLKPTIWIEMEDDAPIPTRILVPDERGETI